MANDEWLRKQLCADSNLSKLSVTLQFPELVIRLDKFKTTIVPKKNRKEVDNVSRLFVANSSYDPFFDWNLAADWETAGDIFLTFTHNNVKDLLTTKLSFSDRKLDFDENGIFFLGNFYSLTIDKLSNRIKFILFIREESTWSKVHQEAQNERLRQSRKQRRKLQKKQKRIEQKILANEEKQRRLQEKLQYRQTLEHYAEIACLVLRGCELSLQTKPKIFGKTLARHLERVVANKDGGYDADTVGFARAALDDLQPVVHDSNFEKIQFK